MKNDKWITSFLRTQPHLSWVVSGTQGHPMVFPPGQGKSGDYVIALWRQYLQECAEREGSVEGQVLVAANHSAEIFGFVSLSLDREGHYRSIIEQRITYFREGLRMAASFEDHLV